MVFLKKLSTEHNLTMNEVVIEIYQMKKWCVIEDAAEYHYPLNIVHLNMLIFIDTRGDQ